MLTPSKHTHTHTLAMTPHISKRLHFLFFLFLKPAYDCQIVNSSSLHVFHWKGIFIQQWKFKTNKNGHFTSHLRTRWCVEYHIKIRVIYQLVPWTSQRWFPYDTMLTNNKERQLPDKIWMFVHVWNPWWWLMTNLCPNSEDEKSDSFLHGKY